MPYSISWKRTLFGSVKVDIVVASGRQPTISMGFNC